MFEFILIASVVAIMFLFRNHDKYVTVYSGNESSLNEANKYYWLLRNHQFSVAYEIPYNWENFYRFGYKESTVSIKVRKKEMENAKQVMMDYRIDQMKMERNIEAERSKQ